MPLPSDSERPPRTVFSERLLLELALLNDAPEAGALPEPTSPPPEVGPPHGSADDAVGGVLTPPPLPSA